MTTASTRVGSAHNVQGSPGRALVRKRDNVIMLALWSVLIARLYWEVFDVTAVMQIGSFNLHIIDLAVIMMLPAVFLVFRFMVPRDYGSLLVLSLLGIVFLSLLRGIIEHGLVVAATAFRWQAIFFVSLFIFSSISSTPERSERIFKTLFVMGWALAVLALARFVVDVNLFKISGDIYSTRALRAAGALLLGQTGVILVGLALSRQLPSVKSQRYFMTGLFFLLITIVSAQRTASIAALAGMLTMLLILPGKYRTMFRILLPAAMLAIALIIAAAISDMGWANFLSNMPKSVQGAFSDNSTFNFREMIWQSVREQFGNFSFFEQLFGASIGSKFSWFLQELGRLFNNSVHNHYLGMLLFFGFIGLGLQLALWVIAISRNLLFNKVSITEFHIPAAVFVGLIVTQIIYSVSYSLPGEQGIILGLALAARYHHSTSSAFNTPSANRSAMASME